MASSCVMSDAAGWKRGEVGDDVMEGNLRDVVADCGMRTHCAGRKGSGREPWESSQIFSGHSMT
jgi:hypothetical protein